MGALCSGPSPGDPSSPTHDISEYRQNRNLQEYLDHEKDDEKEVCKLLLLGAGESGKSTLFKQLQQIYGKPFTDEMRMPYASIVHTNVALSIKTLVKHADMLAESDGTRISPALLGSKNFVEALEADVELPEEAAKHIKLLWADPGIKKAFDLRSLFQLSDSCRHFFDRIDEVARKGYIPTYMDVLQCRARTTGIVENTFLIDDSPFKIVDVGGQRNERKKWIHCFDRVTAVIFVAAINEYDQTLYEDGKTNRLLEAMDLFGEMCNSRWLRHIPMLLFLNKRDLFAEKLQTIPITDSFPEFGQANNYEQGIIFFQEKFLERNEQPESGRQVYVHVTCATDSDNIRFTFNACKDIIIKARLKECGLLL